MRLLAIPPLASAIFAFLLGIFIFLNKPYSTVKRSFALLCFETFYWHSCWFATYFFFSPPQKDLIMRLAWTGIAFIPVTYYQFVIEFLDIQRERKAVRLLYIIIGLFLIPLWTTNTFISGATDFWFGYYPTVGPLHLVYLFIIVGFLFRSVLLLLAALRDPRLSGVERNRKRFAFFCHAVYFFTALEYLINYGVPLYPVGAITMPAAFCVMVYAVTRYQLLDVEVLVKRTAVFAGLFAFVYGIFTLVTILGSEFFKNTLGWNQWVAMIPTVMIVTFTLRPLENLLVNTTEKFLFQKKYDYRELLRTFTNEILTVLDLQKLMDQTVAGLMKIVKLESACILLLDKDTKIYKMVSATGIKQKDITFKEENDLVALLKATHQPIQRDKSVDRMQNSSALRDDFKLLNARLCLPILLHDNLIGILCLGMKKSGEDYTEDDINTLTTVARTEAIAVSNAQLFDELSKTQAEAAQREKMAVIGTLAAGINHEICNPLGIVRGQCEMFLLNLRDGFYKDKSADELLQISADVMNKVNKETDRATGITKKLSGFAKPSKRSELEEVYVEKEVDEVIGLVGHDLKLNNIEFQKDVPADFPAILADKKQIQEVLFNIIRNAAQAMDKKQGKIILSGYSNNGSAVIRIADNGSGIPQDKIDQIFNPFYTTKAPGKGTGLGLFIVKQVVERNKGTIGVESEAGVGTTFTLTFPTATKLVAA